MKQATLGSTIRQLRLQNKMTQATLAKKLNVTDKAVSKWEREVSFPDITLIPVIADTFGITVDDLLCGCIDEDNPSRLIQIFRMSHDIRTPLHIILGCAAMAQLYRDDEERLQRYLENIQISGDYLLQAVNRLMDITQSGKDERKEGSDDIQGSVFTADPETITSRYDFKGKRVLVVEDMELNREIAFELIRRTGAEVEFAENGQVCVEMVSQKQAGWYDLILMDIRMPVMDGIEATKTIRALKNARKASIPIAAMTANVYEGDRHEAIEAGMNDYIEKPISVDRLLDVMRNYLANGKKPCKEGMTVLR